jgi:anti-sigma factor RsiW
MSDHVAEHELQAYLDRELGMERQHEIEGHLRVCGSCRETLVGWESLFDQLESIRDVEMSRSVAPQVVAQVRAQITQQRRLRWLVGAEIVAVGALALALESRGLVSGGLVRLSRTSQAIEPVLSILYASFRLEAAGQWAQVTGTLEPLRSALMNWQPVSLPEAPWMIIMLAAIMLGLIGNGLLLGRQLLGSLANPRVSRKEANHG